MRNRFLRHFCRFAIVPGLYLLNSGCCDHKVAAVILPGDVGDQICANQLSKLTETGSPQPFAGICPGEKVTICWASDVDVSITSADPQVNPGSSGKKGRIVVQPTQSSTVKFKADCAEQSIDLYVIDHPTDVPVGGYRRSDCQSADFSVGPFFSPKVNVTQIAANWVPTETITYYDASGAATGTQTVACTYTHDPANPFLKGQASRVSPPGILLLFPIVNPMSAEKLPHPVPVSDTAWKFSGTFGCPADGRCFDEPVEFVITLECP